jgi:16S rRNA (cytidine1402-2'-O)-methyltransferase
MEPTLYLIPVTLGDTAHDRVLPSYNREVLLSLQHFIVENVRTARRFLKKAEPSIVIDRLFFTELNEHTPSETVSGLLAPMTAGRSLGLMSEAGCPAVADPGADLVALAQHRGYRVVPLTGPSSILMALMGSGFGGQNFAFHGYLPIDPARRTERIRAFETRMYAEHETQIFMETPYRNHSLLEDFIRTCRPSTRLCIACNITCDDEFIRTLPVGEWAKNRPDLQKKPALFLIGLSQAGTMRR